MKKFLLLIVTVFTIISCKEPVVIEINEEELLEHVKELSSDKYQGRLFSTEANKEARAYIIREFEDIGLQPLFNTGYEQEFSVTLTRKKRYEIFPINKNPYDDYSNVPDTTLVGGNAGGFLKGQTNKSIVITAHFDHLGIRDGKAYSETGTVYNGADDNASGTAALFAIAKYFKNKPTKHNLEFVAVDGEEYGMLGTNHFLQTYPNRDNIVLNVNLDMISHSDFDPEIFAAGLYYYPDLRDPLEDVYSEKVTLLFGHDDPNNREQSDWTNSSDHKIFHQAKIPFIYFGVEDHKDYHRHTDTYATINEQFYLEVVKIIIQAIENLDQHLWEEAQ